MAREVASLTARFSADTSGLITGIDRAEGRMRRAARNIGDTLDNIGNRFIGLGAATQALFAPAIISATSFDTSMTNARAILGQTQDEFAATQQAVLDLGRTDTAGPQAAADAFFDIVSGVSDASTHLGILAASQNLADAGQADLTTTTKGLIVAMNAYGGAAEDVTGFSDVYAQTVQSGIGTMDQFVSAMGPIASTAAAAGISFDEVGSSMSFMTAQGVEVSSAARGINAAMTAFMRPNAEMQAALQAMGYDSGVAALEALGLQGALEAVNSETGGIEGNFAAALGSQQALSAGLRLGTVDARVFGITYRQNMQDATAAAKDIQSEAASFSFDLLRSSLAGLAVTVGGALLPGLAQTAESIIPIVEKMTEWAQVNPDIISQLFLMSGGMIVAGVGFKAVAALTGPLSMGFGLVGIALRGVTMAFGLLTSPIMAGIALGFALWLAWQNNFMGIRDIVTGAFEVVKGAFDDLKDKADEVIGWITTNVDISAPFEAVRTFIEGFDLGAAFQMLKDNIANVDFTAVIQDIVRGIARLPFLIVATLIRGAGFVAVGVIQYGPKILEGILNGLGDIAFWVFNNIIMPFWRKLFEAPSIIINALINWGPDILAKILETLGDIFSWVGTNIIGPFVEGLDLGIGDITGAVASVGTDVLAAIKDSFGDIAAWVETNVIDPIINTISGLAHKMADAINTLIPNEVGFDVGAVHDPIFGKEIIPAFGVHIDLPDNPISFARGTPFTGNGAGGFMAQLHPREAVVPAGGMRVIPSQRGLMLDGGGGMVVNIENLQARDLNDLYRQLQNIAKSEGF